MGYFRPLETQRAHASGTCSFLHSFLQLFLFLWLLFSVLVTPSRHHLQMFAAIFFHRQTSKTIRILDQLLDGHQDCMWPSHSGCDYASICTGMRVQAGKSGRPKKGTSFQLSSEEWVLIKDRPHIGSVASTAFIL